MINKRHLGFRNGTFNFKTISLFQIFLIISLTFTLSLSLNSKDVEAAQVCCQKTVNDGFCEQVEETECASDSQRAPTSCEQTSFCKTGCCASGDGYCYSNYPKALCESSDVNGRFSSDSSCETVNECKTGCCVIGGQASFITKSRCIAETANFGDLEVDFRENVENEQECLDIARTAEKGCCVTDSGCNYGAKSECSVKTTINGTGFYKDKYCSQLPSLCNCAPANPSINIGNIRGSGDEKSTMCLPNDDSVYWRDSCGNPEGIKGEKCDYAKGTLCGDSNNDGKATCESLDCKEDGRNTLKEKYSFDFASQDPGKISNGVEKETIKNGETWCLWDYPSTDARDKFYGKDPVGSRHYRSLCINGQELVEPCEDFRKEFCYSNDISILSDANNEFLAARCLKNDRWQSCVNDCNTADPFTMNAEDYKRALKKDQDCCGNIEKRDCQWAGKCVPAVKPGAKFWEGEGADSCGKANLECKAVFVCLGWDSITGNCDPKKNSVGNIVLKLGLPAVGGVAAIAVGPVGWAAFFGGAAGTGVPLLIDEITKEVGEDTGGTWHLVSGGECFSQEYLQSANNYCRSMGDCGADTNWEGDATFDGFTNTEFVNSEIENVLRDLGSKKIKDKIKSAHQRAGNKIPKDVEEFTFNLEEDIPGKIDEPSWEKGEWFFNFVKTKGDNEDNTLRLFRIEDDGAAWAGGLISILGTTGAGALAGGLAGGGRVALASAISSTPGVNVLATIGGKLSTETLKPVVSVEAYREAQIQTLKASIDHDKVVLDLVNSKLETGDGTIPYNSFDEIPREFIKGDGALFTDEELNEALKFEQDEVIKNLKPSQSFAEFMSGVNAGMWVYTAYKLVDVIAEDTKVVSVSSQCKPWQAPTLKEEDQCAKCNSDFVDEDNPENSYVDENGNPININAFKKCSEYRCKSLGTSCALINKGTDKELCVSEFKFDVSPPTIEVWKEGTSEEYRNRITKEGFDQPGFGIKEEIPEYQRFNLALKTDEPSQCKMSFDNGNKFEEMSNTYFGGNIYDYYHIQPIFYASSKNRTTENTLTISTDVDKPKEHKLYVRCQDSQGNSNMNDFVITFTISGAPDITAPVIYGTSIGEEAYITSGQNETRLNLFVNEPGQCKFDLNPAQYNDMKGGTCITSGVDSLGFYQCKFTGEPGAGPMIKDINSKAGQVKYIYFKCQDTSKNFNKEAFRLTLRGSDPLLISEVMTEPKAVDNEIKTSLITTPVSLIVTTENGAKLNGQSVCKYTQQESLKDNYAAMSGGYFTETNSSRHKIILDQLSTGEHKFFIGCSDVAGNLAFNEISFSLTSDVNPPAIVRTYKDSGLQPPVFKIELNEEGICKDNLVQFDFDKEGNLMTKDGNVHISSSEQSNLYYVICRDSFNNTMSQAQIQFV